MQKLRLTNENLLLPSQSPSIYTCALTACTVVSAKVLTLLGAPNLVSLSKLVTNTLKHAQTPPVCQTLFPSDPSRGEARVEVADTLLVPSVHYCVSVCVRACLSNDATHMADRNRRWISSHCLGDGEVAQCTFASLRRIYSNVCSVIDGRRYRVQISALRQHLHQSATVLQPWQ